LYIIGAGPIPPNPSEMIMDAKMDELFTYLRANFDIIIIDSAPVGLVSDSKILAKYADATLYVVRQRYTVKKQLSFINDLYEGKVLPNMGIIVNDVKIGGSNSYYGYGYGYGYGYSYNYNYSYSYGEKDKRTVMQKIRDLIGL
jgi:tyrosine-protein kinase Etk/Wzc